MHHNSYARAQIAEIAAFEGRTTKADGAALIDAAVGELLARVGERVRQALSERAYAQPDTSGASMEDRLKRLLGLVAERGFLDQGAGFLQRNRFEFFGRIRVPPQFRSSSRRPWRRVSASTAPSVVSPRA